MNTILLPYFEMETSSNENIKFKIYGVLQDKGKKNGAFLFFVSLLCRVTVMRLPTLIWMHSPEIRVYIKGFFKIYNVHIYKLFLQIMGNTSCS